MSLFEAYRAANKNQDPNKTETIRELLASGADVSETSSGYTLLHIAASSGDHATVSVLPQHGADVQAQDNQGDTPLHSAGSFGTDADTFLQADIEAHAHVKVGFSKISRPIETHLDPTPISRGILAPHYESR